jgi:anaerobic selenocysteine-containing dehydrogenase
MEIQRRTFLGLASAAGAGGMLKGLFGVSLGPTEAFAHSTRPIRGKLTTTICPFCSVGCSMLVSTVDGKVVNLTGDPDHPINEGATCSKGAALRQIWNNDQRVTKVLYRAPGASAWEERTGTGPCRGLRDVSRTRATPRSRRATAPAAW